MRGQRTKLLASVALHIRRPEGRACRFAPWPALQGATCKVTGAICLADKVKLEPGDMTVALYHMVYRHERFEHATAALFEVVRYAERTHPG